MREEAQWIDDRLEGTLRVPDTDATAIVVIAHPLPTHGGTMRNPLMAALARAVAERGWSALRFNFRGVGKSNGEWSGGQSEHEDLAAAVDHARRLAPGLPLGVIGFSFGSSMVLRWLEKGGRADAYVLLGVALRSPTGEPRELAPVPAGAFIVNGENDEFAAPRELREQLPQATVREIRATDHYFTGKRDEVARMVTDRLGEEFRPIR